MPETAHASLEHIPCPLCAAADHRPWGEENGFAAVKCAECGLVYVNPRPRADAITEASRIGMHRIEDGDLKVTYRPNWGNDAMYKRDISAAFADEIATGKPVRWLDVGAGYGEFITSLKAVLPAGSVVQGVEPMAEKVKYAKGMGLPVTDAALDEIHEQFDVVSIMNVFSHVPDFREFLSQLGRLIVPGGSLYIRTGNGGDLDSRKDYPDKLDLPDHLVFAGERHLQRFLAEADFSVIWQRADRLDTVPWMVKSIVKRALGRTSPIALPYRSPFRDLRLRARSGVNR